MRRLSSLSSVTALAAVLGLAPFTACDSSDDSSEAQQFAARLAKIKACHMDDGTVDAHDTDVRACEPGNTKKTTICHVPPGNPANAHTLCIGNAAVKHHLKNHPDYLGPCKVEATCPPAGTTPDAGSTPVVTPDSGGTGGTSGTGGTAGTGGGGGEPVIE